MRFAAVTAGTSLALWLTFVGAGMTAESRGLSVPLRESEAKDAPVVEEVRLYSRSYALVIGIDDYKGGWPRLSNAIEDAHAIAAELRGQAFEVDLRTNLDSRALEDALKTFFAIKGADPEARLFLWFAGHGHTEDGEGYLVPADSPRPDGSGRFRLSALSLRRIGEYVRLAKAKHAFGVFDSCFAGTVFESARALPPTAITRATTLPVRQFLTSGDAGQTVSDDGSFRDLFIRALHGEERADANGDGYITASELGLFLSDRVTNLTQSRQTPRYGKLRDKTWDRGDFVFRTLATAPGRTVAHAAKSSPVGLTPEMLFWESIKNSTDRADFEAYVRRYPQGTFVDLAQNRLTALSAPLRPAQQPAPVSRGDSSTGCSGRYTTWWGSTTTMLTLTFGADGRVSGAYDYEGGRIDGTLSGRHLVGRYRQSGNGQSGDIEFDFDDSCHWFVGTWKNTSSFFAGGGSWNGCKRPDVNCPDRVKSD